MVEVVGRAPAGARVTLRNPDGQAVATSAAADGGWVVRIPTTLQPRLYSLAAEAGRRSVRGEGALAISAPPGPAALALRPAAQRSPCRLPTAP